MLSPASIACACSRSPSILIVMPVRACSSRSLSKRARADLARLVQHQDRVAVRLELAAVDLRQQMRQRVGPADPGVLQRIRLAPGHRGTDHLAALRAEPRVGLPGVHQGLQQRRLAGAGDAGEHRQRAALPEGVDARRAARA